MRLSIPNWGRPHTHVRIHSAEAIAFRVPMDLGAEDTRRTAAPLNYLIVLAGATGDGTPVKGIGEAQPRLGQTGDEHGLSWSFLDDALKSLVGQTIDLRQALADISDCVQAVEEAAGTEDSNASFRFRATVMGIEASLLDLVARAKGLTVADLLGRRTVRQATMPTSMRRRDPEEVEQFLAQLPRHRGSTLRLVGTGDLESDLKHLRLVADIRSRVRRGSANSTIWMNFEGKLDAVQAREAISDISLWAGEGRLPGEVIIQNPVPREEYNACLSLQAYADKVSPYPSAPVVKVLPRNVGPEATEELLRSGGDRLRIVNLRPAQLGGVMRTLHLADSTVEPSQIDVMLTHFPGASRVTQMLHRDLSQAVPNMRFLAAGADIERRFRVSRRSSVWRRSPLLRRGNGLEVEYRGLVPRARNRIIHPLPRRPDNADPSPNVYDDVDFIAPIGPYAVHGHIVEREALAYGLNSWRFTKSSFVATDDSGKEVIPFRRSRWPLSGSTAASVAKHKEATRILLMRAGCPVPEGRTFAGGDERGALDFAARIGYPVVLKPAEGSMGVGVVADIGSTDELQTALAMLGRTIHGEDDFIVEKHIRGADYRIMVMGDEVVAAVKRRPASVVGDGVQTVGQLMMEKNVERQRNPHLGQLRIPWNEATAHELAKSGYAFDDVPAFGVRLNLSSTSNLTQGGDSLDVLDELHPSITEKAVRATRAVPGMEYCGVDFLLEDHTQPLEEQGGAICELNVMAALPVGEYPAYGESRPLAERFIKECAHAYDLVLRSERAKYLQLELSIRGGVSGVGYRRWFARRARSFGLRGWIFQRNERELRARICGPTAPVTALVTAAILGPPKAAPESVYTTHGDGPQESDFVILDMDEEPTDLPDEIGYSYEEEERTAPELAAASSPAMESDEEVP